MSAGIARGGMVYVWGESNMRFGDPNFAPRALPTPIPGIPGKVASLAIGDWGALALTKAGEVWGWGDELSGLGAMGHGGGVAAKPVRLKGLPKRDPVVKIGAGRYTGAAMTKSGAMWVWGDGLEDHCFGLKRIAAFSRTNPVRDFGVGRRSVAALSGKGEIYMWETDYCGVADNNGHGLLTKISGLSEDDPIVKVAVGRDEAIGLTGSGVVWSWKLSRWPFPPVGEPVPIEVSMIGGLPRKEPISTIEASDSCFYGLTKTGRLYAWGSKSCKEKGISRNPVTATRIQAKAGALTSFAAGSSHAIAVAKRGRTVAWGENYYGELGLGEYTRPKATPQRVRPPEEGHPGVEVTVQKRDLWVDYRPLTVEVWAWDGKKDIGGKVLVQWGKEKRTLTLGKHGARTRIKGLPLGKHVIRVTYLGNGKYKSTPGQTVFIKIVDRDTYHERYPLRG